MAEPFVGIGGNVLPDADVERAGKVSIGHLGLVPALERSPPVDIGHRLGRETDPVVGDDLLAAVDAQLVPTVVELVVAMLGPLLPLSQHTRLDEDLVVLDLAGPAGARGREAAAWQGHAVVLADPETSKGLAEHRVGGHGDVDRMDAVRPVVAEDSLGRLPDPIAVEVDPGVDVPAGSVGAVDLERDRVSLARHQHGNLHAVFVIVAVVVVAQRRRIGLAVRLTVRRVARVAQPRAAKFVTRAIADQQRRVAHDHRIVRRVAEVQLLLDLLCGQEERHVPGFLRRRPEDRLALRPHVRYARAGHMDRPVGRDPRRAAVDAQLREHVEETVDLELSVAEVLYGVAARGRAQGVLADLHLLAPQIAGEAHRDDLGVKQPGSAGGVDTQFGEDVEERIDEELVSVNVRHRDIEEHVEERVCRERFVRDHPQAVDPHARVAEAHAVGRIVTVQAVRAREDIRSGRPRSRLISQGRVGGVEYPNRVVRCGRFEVAQYGQPAPGPLHGRRIVVLRRDADPVDPVVARLQEPVRFRKVRLEEERRLRPGHGVARVQFHTVKGHAVIRADILPDQFARMAEPFVGIGGNVLPDADVERAGKVSIGHLGLVPALERSPPVDIGHRLGRETDPVVGDDLLAAVDAQLVPTVVELVVAMLGPLLPLSQHTRLDEDLVVLDLAGPAGALGREAAARQGHAVVLADPEAGERLSEYRAGRRRNVDRMDAVGPVFAEDPLGSVPRLIAVEVDPGVDVPAGVVGAVDLERNRVGPADTQQRDLHAVLVVVAVVVVAQGIRIGLAVGLGVGLIVVVAQPRTAQMMARAVGQQRRVAHYSRTVRRIAEVQIRFHLADLVLGGQQADVRRLVVLAEQHDPTERDCADEPCDLRGFLADDCIQPQGLLIVQQRPTGQFDLEQHVEEALGVARMERIQIQPAGRVVHLLLDPAQRRGERALGDVPHPHRHVPVGQVHRNQLRHDLIRGVAVIVDGVSVGGALEVDMDLGGPLQDKGLRYGAHRSADEFHHRRRILQYVDFRRRVGLVDSAEDVDPRSHAGGRVDQLYSREERIRVALAVLRRLVVNRRLETQGLVRHHKAAAHDDLRPDVEEAVGHGTCGERVHIEPAVADLHLLLDQSGRRPIEAHGRLHRARRGHPAQVHAHQFGLHFVASIAVIVRSISYIMPLEEYVHLGRAHQRNQLRGGAQLHACWGVGGDPTLATVHAQLSEHVEEAVYVVQPAAEISDARIPLRGLCGALLDRQRDNVAPGRFHLARQCHGNDFSLEVSGRVARLAGHARLDRAGQLDRERDVVQPQRRRRHDRRAPQRRSERLDLVATDVHSRHRTVRPVGQALEDNFQLGTVVSHVCVPGRPVLPALGGQFRAVCVDPRLGQHHPRGLRGGDPRGAAVDGQFREDVEEAVYVVQPSAEIGDLRAALRGAGGTFANLNLPTSGDVPDKCHLDDLSIEQTGRVTGLAQGERLDRSGQFHLHQFAFQPQQHRIDYHSRNQRRLEVRLLVRPHVDDHRRRIGKWLETNVR